MKNLPNHDWVKTRAVDNLEGVKIHASHFIRERTAPRHVHHDYAFGLAIEGAIEIDCGHCGETHILQPDSLLLTEANEVYAGRALGKPPWRYLSILISKEKLTDVFNSLADGKEIKLPHFTQAAVKNNEFRQLFLAFYESLNDDRTALEQESLLFDWLSSISKNYTDNSNNIHNRRIYSETRAVRRVRKYIRENVAENIRLESLAEIARLSPFHLNRTFSAQIGLPPHQFQNQLRIERSVELITQKKNLAEIAFETGFSDQSHFNRFFKRYIGVTPKRFLAR
jgi:AraC-like DNA-binding protein/quercetin dioxygenase-like cupin family protein